jgi:hypothetical protein
MGLFRSYAKWKMFKSIWRTVRNAMSKRKTRAR